MEKIRILFNDGKVIEVLNARIDEKRRIVLEEKPSDKGALRIIPFEAIKEIKFLKK